MLTPKEIVDALDRHIVGQDSAKRAVAIALRNRYRRSRLSAELREDITPKNIIMVGPTGVGKTEIARRLAKLVDAPLVKVEATKFTEVGYVGRDVDSMIRDLVEASIRLCKQRKQAEVRILAETSAEQRLIDLLTHSKSERRAPVKNPLQMLLSAGTNEPESAPGDQGEEQAKAHSKREAVADELRAGLREEDIVEIEVDQALPQNDAMYAIGVDINLNEMFDGIIPRRKKLRKLTVKEARRIITQEESDKLIDIEKAQRGIVYIDEIDKIIGTHSTSGPDVSREGVQRDILPIVEGSTVSTKYGSVKTDHILFIAAGAFHVSKISDMIPELQGRFPIKVELSPLTADDFKRILTQPENSIIKQYTALLEADSVALSFTDDALTEIAKHAYTVNETTENIGARRLHTVMEHLLDDISFNANGNHPLVEVVIDESYVNERLKYTDNEGDLKKFII